MTDPQKLHSEEAEESLLGSMLIDPEAVDAVSAIVAPGDHWLRANALVHEAIIDASSRGGADVVTVRDSLERAGRLADAGGATRLADLVAATPSSLRAAHYAEIIREYAVRRALLAAASGVARAAHDLEAPLDEAQAAAEKAVLDARRRDGRRIAGARAVASSVYDQVDEWANSPLVTGQVRGLATGVGAIDRALGGLEPGVYVVAGRPSMGKTSVALQMVEGLCMGGKSIALFSIEMSARQIGLRLATSYACVELEALRHGRTEPAETSMVMDALGVMNDWQMTIIDQATLRPGDVLAQCRRIRSDAGALDAVFVDGLWLMTPTRDRESRVQNVGSISREMKRVQRELDVPLVMTHQLSRACEQRADKRPILSDLRETGDVEQDSDVVVMLYRDEYYNPETETPNIMEAWIRKNRLGGRANVCARMFWRARFMRCADIETREVMLP